MEIGSESSKAAVPDTVLQGISVVSTGASSFGALGVLPSPTLEPCAAVTPASSSSSQFHSSLSSYTVGHNPSTAADMSIALAESSTAPVNFFSSLPVSSVVSCSAAAEAQVPMSTYHPASACFDALPPAYLFSSPPAVTLAGTASCSSASAGPFADASTAYERCTTLFGPAQPDMYNSFYGSSESAPAISAEPLSQFVTQPPVTEAEISPSLRALDRYYGELAPVSSSVSAGAEKPSLLVVGDRTDAPTSIRVIDDDNDDPTLLRVTDDLDDLSASHPNVPIHSAEFSSSVVELPPQSSITAEELSSLRIPSETIPETVPTLPTLSVTYSSGLSDPPVVGASTDLSTERSSLLPSASPPSGTSTIMPPFIVELEGTFPSQSSLIVPKTEPDCSPLLVPKLERQDASSGSAGVSYGVFSVVMVASSLDPNCREDSSPDLMLYASSSEPSSPSTPSSSSPSSDPNFSELPDFPEFRPSYSPSETKPPSPSSLDPLPSECMAASTLEATSKCSPSSAVSFTNSLTSSPCECGNGIQSSDPIDWSPSYNSGERTETSTIGVSPPVSSTNEAPLSPSDTRSVVDYEVNSRPPPLPAAAVVPRGRIKKGEKGKGWPYGPQGWPNVDDKWPWRVGRRGNPSGFYKDRFLGLPISLVRGEKLVEFASKKAVVGFLKQNFPHLDVDIFFKAFQWRIPCVIHRSTCPAEVPNGKGEKRQREAEVDEETEHPAKRSKKQCKVGNLKCGIETGRSVLLGPVPALHCDVCCSEPGFCRECMCILCCEIIVPDFGECNLVRCLQKPAPGGICGHGAHLECALNSQMAGVVKNRGLDMEYLCRRCDKKTDLRELVTRLLEAVGNTLQRAFAEKNLQRALQIMQGTEHGGNGARVLESLVQSALLKVQSGADIQEVFSDLREQGIAAEAAKQQHLVRASSTGEDGSQQPEASLDQWLPSGGSPSSHPSPGTPSSFSSPIIRSNPSVNSSADGTEGTEGRDDKHTGVAHTDDSGEAVRSPGKKSSISGSEPSSSKRISQVRISHRVRAGSSTTDIIQEAICDSQAIVRNGKFSADEHGSRSLNVGGMKKSEHRGSSTGAGMHREDGSFSGHCRSCGARRPTGHGLEVTSNLQYPKVEDGGHKSHPSSPSRKEGNPMNQSRLRHTYDSEKETDYGGTGSHCTSSAAVVSSEERSGVKILGVSARLLEEKCQQQVQLALQKLRQAQHAEFVRAEERLIAQKDMVMKQYELLEIARSEVDEAETPSHLQDFDEMMLKVSTQFTKATNERQTFETMMEVSDGFGMVPKEDLKRFFGWPSERGS